MFKVIEQTVIEHDGPQLTFFQSYRYGTYLFGLNSAKSEKYKDVEIWLYVEVSKEKAKSWFSREITTRELFNDSSLLQCEKSLNGYIIAEKIKQFSEIPDSMLPTQDARCPEAIGRQFIEEIGLDL